MYTPGPWDYVPSTEHHGPYVTSQYGNTICDCYVMSQPYMASTANGGPSKPISFMYEMADPNARLIAAAPDLLEALEDMISDAEKQMANPSHHMPFSMNKAKAAIAKATVTPTNKSEA